MGELILDLYEARSRADAAKVRAVAAARAAAGAQEQAAISMERAADLGVPSAALLRDMSIAARRRAARRQRWASDHAAGTLPARRDDDDDRTVIRERDRIAAQLQDTVVRRAFAVGLTLHGAAGLTSEPEVRRRVEAAIDELDQVIREIRQAIFTVGLHAHVSGPEILDLGRQLASAARAAVPDAGTGQRVRHPRPGRYRRGRLRP